MVYLQARAVLAEGSLHLQLLFYGSICHLGAVALHLCCCTEGTFHPPRRILHILQLALQPLELRLPLCTRRGGQGSDDIQKHTHIR